ncbi:thiamine-phosphate diphosphorylase [Pseudorhodobacter antarcticus]|jgi:thiamine-phosphate pyrophosphorylase|uniref:Thiamine-phosphate synthase n=1 Tax=Pseudorhodobacter antarcticus TaxID=1077947 RepID=A0A1H8LDS9_9RHOB|nr:thiamine phosphate synthase [Pseudorhodobacter antarcticus]SEO03291.1 thiamine-phosphate diphosphorylase [Pseudorhodobacter antarcticus]
MRGPIYVITDPGAALPVAEQARAAARGGAAWVQLRDKTASDDDLAALIRLLLPEMAAFGTMLIVNDRVEVALATGAHGLHIGQGDGDAAAIHQRMPPAMILGLSVETVAQARLIPPGVDYIGAGPVRATPTKPDHATPIGFDGLAQIVAATALPAFAIGGLKPCDARAVRGTGALGMAVVSAVTRAPDPEAATRALLAEWGMA